MFGNLISEFAAYAEAGLEAEVTALRAELDAARTEADRAVEDAHRQHRRDLVPLKQSITLYRRTRRPG